MYELVGNLARHGVAIRMSNLNMVKFRMLSRANVCRTAVDAFRNVVSDSNMRYIVVY